MPVAKMTAASSKRIVAFSRILIRYCASWVGSRLIACASFPACHARDGYLGAFLAFAQRFF